MCEHVPKKIYGMVTNGICWVFLRLEGKSIKGNEDTLFLVRFPSLGDIPADLAGLANRVEESTRGSFD